MNPRLRRNLLLGGKKFKSRYSFLFDGVDEDILIGTSSTLDFTTSFSISAWIYLTDLSHINTIFFRSTSSPYKGYAFAVTTAGKPNMLVEGGSANGITTSSTVLLVNTWYHLGCTKSSGAAPKFYVNGTETAYDVTGTLNPTTNGSDARIGGTGSIDGWTGRQFEGNEDEVGIFNTELLASQMSEIYSNGKPKNLLNHSSLNNLVSYWRMGDKSTWDGTNWTLVDQKG